MKNSSILAVLRNITDWPDCPYPNKQI